jgi:hypothetical protein
MEKNVRKAYGENINRILSRHNIKCASLMPRKLLFSLPLGLKTVGVCSILTCEYGQTDSLL